VSWGKKGSFHASKRWFANFKKQKSLHDMRKGQNQPCANHVAGNKQTEYFEEAYLPQQVFNSKQTHLFWKEIPTCM
jgi:hypothetical protein